VYPLKFTSSAVGGFEMPPLQLAQGAAELAVADPHHGA
jgi:hypothetical protein